MPLPPQDVLLHALDYNPDTGVLIWKIRIGGKQKIGKIAGCKRPDGYIMVWYKRQGYMAHRLIWKMLYNEEPPIVDHRDLNPSNNSRENLRAANERLNQTNRMAPSNNTTGAKGIHLLKASGRYLARSMVNGERITIGDFDSLAAAQVAYNEFVGQNLDGFGRPQ